MELAIDTAGDMAMVGLSEQGVARLEFRWHCYRNHNAELLPAIDEMLRRAHITKQDLTAVFVCTGPGSYMGVRVGIAVAKGFALALGIPLIGVSRLALDAWAHRAYDGPIVPVHRAGRSEWAWAAYEWQRDDWLETVSARLATADALALDAPGGALICGEPDSALLAAVRPARFVRGQSAARRPASLCELGWERLQRHGPDDAAALGPLYLREPAIGPQG